MISVKIYLVYDKKKEEYWQTPNNKYSWSSRGAAKNAWNHHITSGEFPEGVKEGRYGRDIMPHFDAQQRFVVHEIEATTENAKEV